MTFDVISDIPTVRNGYGLQLYEIFSVCRRCQNPSVMLIAQRSTSRIESDYTQNSISASFGDIESNYEFIRFMTIADVHHQRQPDTLPQNIDAAFVEGAKCLSIGCNNAAAAMFRLCLDLATKGLLPPDDSAVMDKHTRRNLAPRLRWLFENSILPADLKELSSAVKENGDEGAHDGSLSTADAEDIYEFSYELLDRLFAQPERIAAAKRRREERRQASN